MAEGGIGVSLLCWRTAGPSASLPCASQCLWITIIPLYKTQSASIRVSAGAGVRWGGAPRGAHTLGAQEQESTEY